MKTRYKYFQVIVSPDMFYRVSIDPVNVCQYAIGGQTSGWSNSCVNRLVNPARFQRVSRDFVRSRYPTLFR